MTNCLKDATKCWLSIRFSLTVTEWMLVRIHKEIIDVVSKYSKLYTNWPYERLRFAA
jgi:hypothetical protein